MIEEFYPKSVEALIEIEKTFGKGMYDKVMTILVSASTFQDMEEMCEKHQMSLGNIMKEIKNKHIEYFKA